jgi:protein ImuA
MLAELRKTLALLERPPGLEDPGVVPLGIEPIDAALGGGLARGALHEIAAASEAHVASATGFAVGISSPSCPAVCRASTAWRHKKKDVDGRDIGERSDAVLRTAMPGHDSTTTIVFVTEDMALIESGAPCGSGLDELGLAPERLIMVSAARLSDLLWTMEEALHSPAVSVVIGEVRHQAIDAVALRRLSLAAASHGALALLVRATPPDDISTAATRWIVRAAASSVTHGQNYFFGPPRIEAQLVRNRRGPLGSWTLEWSEFDERFVLASMHAEPVAAAAFDRPAREVA